MRVLIFGATGMLGHNLYLQFRRKFELFATIRSDFDSIRQFGIFEESEIIENIDVTDPASIRSAIEYSKPDVVVNAVGVIKQLLTSQEVIQTLMINSIFPHRLAELSREFGFRLITISTDCVFDGKEGNYKETHTPNASDLYGMSKLLGEVSNGGALTIRTSIIGRELASCHSIVEWFLTNRGGKVEGFTNAIYSGLPSGELAAIIEKLITNYPDLNGLYHVSSEPISKYDLLELLNSFYDSNVEIEPSNEVVIDRSLDSSKFAAATGLGLKKWDEMISQMVRSTTPYELWRD